jgi:hypothetical protein
MRAFSILAALATAIQAVALITLHVLPTGYNPVRDAVSDYGVGPYRGWFYRCRPWNPFGSGSVPPEAAEPSSRSVWKSNWESLKITRIAVSPPGQTYRA